MSTADASGTPAGTTTEVQAIIVPLNADGTIGTLPEPLQKLFDARIREATARAKAKTPDPVEAERAQQEKEELEALRLEKAENGKQYEAAKKLTAEKHQRELEAERQARAKERTRAEKQARARGEEAIRSAALKAGARDESVDELVDLLSRRIELEEVDDDLKPIVKGDDGQPIEFAAMVGSYLDAKPHHKKAAGGKSMGAGGGATTTTGQPATNDKVAEIQARIAKQGRATAADQQALREALAST